MKKIILVLLLVLLLVGMGQLSYSSGGTALEWLRASLSIYSDIEGDLQWMELIGAEYLLSQITKPRIMKELTEDEKAQVMMLSSKVAKAKEGLTQEQLEQLAREVARARAELEFEAGEELTSEELAELDTVLRSQWNEMRAALAQNDIDKATSYFSVSTREAYRNVFTALSPEKRSQLAQDLGDIQFIQQRQNTLEYDLRRIKDGKVYSYLLLFIKDDDGVWRIKAF